ncbi:MAG: MFS transporter [Acidimicrobiales bacterium]
MGPAVLPAVLRRSPALAAVFLAFGMFWGTWAVAAADIQRTLGLSTGGLGVLLSVSVGSGGIAAAASTSVVERWGAPLFVVRAVLFWGLAGLAAGLVPGRAAFVVAMIAAVVGAGLVDMAMNTAAADRLRGDASAMMRLHALFNAGALVGAATTGGLVRAGLTWRWSWTVLGAASALTAALLVGGLLRNRFPARPGASPGPATEASTPGSGSILRSLAVLRSLHLLPLALAFVGTAWVEGGIDTWGVLYLRRHLAVGVLLGAGAYGVGQVVAVCVRSSGAGMAGRAGPRRGMIAGALTAGTGLVVEAASTHPVGAAIGLGLAAAGISLCWPLAMAAISARAATEGISPAPLAGAMTAAGYIGWVAGPAVIGWIADVAGLRIGILVLAVVGVAAAGVVATVPLHSPR